MVIYLSLLIALIGAVMHILCANPKLAEIGRVMMFCGLLAFLIGLPGHPLGVIPR